MRTPFVVLLATATLALAQHSYTPGDIQEGGRLFRLNCISCHGPDGDQVAGIDLGHGKFRQNYGEDALIAIVLNGIPNTAMPPNALNEFSAGAVIAYLKSMATAGRTAGTGDAAKGKVIFESKGACASCHRIRGSGSRVGPDLSEIGALRRTVELEHALTDPNEEVLAQNRFYRAVTKTGETVVGTLLNADTFTLQIRDGKDRLVSLQRANLKEAAFVEGSPMPSYKDKLTAAELTDLVTYLASLKGF